jgi:Icc-related predicted phosphoesterase
MAPFGRKATGKLTRIFFATDLHGSDVCFRKFMNAPRFYQTNTLILGGDLTGKFVTPIISHNDGSYELEYLGKKTVAGSEQEVAALEKRIANMGGYSFRTTQNEVEQMQANPQKVKERFDGLMAERLTAWVKMGDEVAKASGVRIYMTGGNDDEYFVDSILKSASSVVNANGQVVDIDGMHEMIGCAYSNITPFKCPRDIPEEELMTRIEEMAAKVQDPKNAVFNLHVPPINSDLDLCPKVDTSTNPPKLLIQNGNVLQYNAGSTSVRAVLEKHQPLVGLHGHIHESSGVKEIGRTVCFNPGSEYGEGVLRGFIISLSDKKVASYQFVSG